MWGGGGVRARACACMCVCARACVCVCENERERKGGGGGEEGVYVNLCTLAENLNFSCSGCNLLLETAISLLG